MKNKMVHFWQKQSGYGLVELMVSLPILILMLLSLSAAFLWFLKSYLLVFSEFELHNQVRMPMERIAHDLTYADQAALLSDGIRIFVWNSQGNKDWVVYTFENSRIYRDTQPLTGDTRIGDMVITKFQCEQKEPRNIYIEIEGKNLTTGYTFSLETAVQLLDKSKDI